MPLAGAGFGAARALEQIVADRLAAERLEQVIAERERAAQLERDRFAETQRQNQIENDRTSRLDEERRTERAAARDTAQLQQRGRANMAGVVAMGVDPATAKREIAFSSLQSGADVPGGVIEALTPPRVERDPIADHEAKLKLEAKYRPPQRPERDPIADYEARLKLDQQYKTNAQGADPVKAREKGLSMLEAARALRSHKGLSGLTGARIGNPDYALGVSEEPIAGSPAADAAPFFNQLKSQFTLDNIGLLKGVLSDSDMKILQQASTALDTKMQDATFVAELDKVIQKLEAAFGGSPPSTLPPMNPTSSRGTGRGAGGPAAAVDVDALIAKYGGKR